MIVYNDTVCCVMLRIPLQVTVVYCLLIFRTSLHLLWQFRETPPDVPISFHRCYRSCIFPSNNTSPTRNINLIEKVLQSIMKICTVNDYKSQWRPNTKRNFVYPEAEVLSERKNNLWGKQ